MHLVFLGPPGAGKGTQAKRVAAAHTLAHLSTGDMLRDAMAKGTPVGLKVKDIVASGELVPDDVVDALVSDNLTEIASNGGYILDGYPRKLSQAQTLSGVLAGLKTPLSAVIYIHVEDEELVRRLSGRAAREGRADDTEETVRERLRVYRESTAPLVQHYGAQGLLRRINGAGSIDEVNARIESALEEDA